MATEFNPNGTIDKGAAGGRSINPPIQAETRRRNWSGVIAIAAITALVVFGLLSMRDLRQAVSNTQPAATTTGIAPSSPPTVQNPQS